MMFALRANDAAPYGAVGKQHIIAPIESSIMIREANHIIFARKNIIHLPPEEKAAV